MFVCSGDLMLLINYSLKLVAQNNSIIQVYMDPGYGQSVSRQFHSVIYGFNWVILSYLNSFLWWPLCVFFTWSFGLPSSMVAHALGEHAFQRDDP